MFLCLEKTRKGGEGMENNEYIMVIPVKPKRGDTIKKAGIAGEGRLVAISDRYMVVAWKGYGENPGSRHSGLYSYYPARTAVYKFMKLDHFGRPVWREILDWKTRK
jgi:hypothetical protein